jgi:hypothetical protein
MGIRDRIGRISDSRYLRIVDELGSVANIRTFPYLRGDSCFNSVVAIAINSDMVA